MRQMIVLSVAMGIVAAAGFGLSACGGGGGSGGGGTSSSSSITSSSSSSSSIAGAASNVVTAEVDGGPAGVNAIDTLYVTVTICQPGSTTNCIPIPNVQVDTGSYGLRIVYGALTPTQWASLGLTQEATATSQPIAECAQWADGYSWGPVVTADVQISSETGSSVPVHVLEGTTYSAIPPDCANGGVNGEEDTVVSFGANGILGVGPFVNDCGPGCAPGNGNTPVEGTYYDCASGATSANCTDPGNEVLVAQNEQVNNPVAYFATDNNGVIVELPSISASGAATATCVVVFGIGTETNNKVGGATVFPATAQYGTITTVFSDDTGGNTTLTGSYFDTGSNGIFFTDSNLATCTVDTGFFCPSTTQSFNATVEGSSGTPSQVFSFSVGNADNLTVGSLTAFNDLAGTLPTTQNNLPGGPVFDWGLPFFFGQNIFVAIDCTSNSTIDAGVANCATSAPFFATISN
jgi:Protein of unknown function (DUF3443)